MGKLESEYTGWGVALYYKFFLSVEVLDTPIPAGLEVTVFQVRGDGVCGTLCVGCYRPPSKKPALTAYLSDNLDHLISDHVCNNIISAT